jgi:hypothetical protein
VKCIAHEILVLVDVRSVYAHTYIHTYIMKRVAHEILVLVDVRSVCIDAFWLLIHIYIHTCAGYELCGGNLADDLD